MDEKEKIMFYLLELEKATDPRFALFMRDGTRKCGKAAFFKCLLPSKETAVEVARKYASEQAQRGHLDFSYYVVELKHHVGIKGGKIVDMAIE